MIRSLPNQLIGVFDRKLYIKIDDVQLPQRGFSKTRGLLFSDDGLKYGVELGKDFL